MRIMTAIKVRCATSEELNGMYKANEVRQELAELGIKFVDWLEWVLDHLFVDADGWNGSLQAIVANEATEEVVLRIGQHKVKFIKYYNIEV